MADTLNIGIIGWGGSPSKPEVNEARSWINAIRTDEAITF